MHAHVELTYASLTSVFLQTATYISCHCCCHRITRGLVKLSGDRLGLNRDRERKKKSLNLYGGLGNKFSDLLDMQEANSNMVTL